MPDGSWLKIDNGWSRHPKVRRAGMAGRGLWMAAATEIAAVEQNGVVRGDMLADYGWLADIKPGQIKTVAQKLVEVRLWHTLEGWRSCPRCSAADGELGPQDFYFHDWRIYNPVPAGASEEQKKRAIRDTQLEQMKELKLQIARRDCGLCRYCGITLLEPKQRSGRGGDRKSDTWRAERTLDHRDPDGPNTLGNLVQACRGCNGDKGQRTNDEWVAAGGRCLLIPGTRASQIEGLDQTEIKALFGHRSNDGSNDD